MVGVIGVVQEFALGGEDRVVIPKNRNVGVVVRVRGVVRDSLLLLVGGRNVDLPGAKSINMVAFSAGADDVVGYLIYEVHNSISLGSKLPCQ